MQWGCLEQPKQWGIGYYPVFAEGLRLPCQAPILIHLHLLAVLPVSLMVDHARF